MSRQSVQQHFLFLREICSAHLLADPMTLGGRNIVVQIDESLFRHKPKYHHGRAVAGAQWVFGACDTSSTPAVAYMELVLDQRAATLIPSYRGSSYPDRRSTATSGLLTGSCTPTPATRTPPSTTARTLLTR